MKVRIHDTDGNLVTFDKPIVITFLDDEEETFGLHIDSLKKILKKHFENQCKNGRGIIVSSQIHPETP